jgi:hypothetical protein
MMLSLQNNNIFKLGLARVDELLVRAERASRKRAPQNDFGL